MIRISLTLILLVCFSGCAGHREDIGHGLKFIDLSYQNYAIIDDDGVFVIYPKIYRYCRKEGKIFGFRIDPKGDNSDGSIPFTTNLGYFELDIKTRDVVRKPNFKLDDFDDICGWKILPKNPRTDSPEYPIETN